MTGLETLPVTGFQTRQGATNMKPRHAIRFKFHEFL